MKSNREAVAGVDVLKNCQKDLEEDRLKMLHSLLRQRTKQLEMISKDTTEQRKQVVKKNQIISEYETLYENLKQTKEKDTRLLKDELVYRNNVIKSQLQTIEKLRLKIRKMDSLLPVNQYDAIDEEVPLKLRARAKGISAEPRDAQNGTVMKKNIEDFFFQKRQRFVVFES